MAMSNELGKKKPVKKNKSSSRNILKGIIPWKGDSFFEVIRKILFMVALAVLVFALNMLYEYYYGERAVKELNSTLEAIYSQSSDENRLDSSDESAIEKPVEGMLDKFVQLYNMNSDIIGWVEIPGVLSYPVMQTEDNEYYLSHSFDRTESKAGAVFADYRGEISIDHMPDNTILYGHNMESGEFFHQNLSYKKIDFLKENPVISFDTLFDESEWKIFACFLTSVKASQDGGVLFDYHNRIYFNNEESFNDYYSEVMKRSYYNTAVDVVYGDELLTLSTCSTEFTDSRFVIVARKVRPGESSEVDVSQITANPNKYMPLVWYEVYNIKPPR